VDCFKGAKRGGKTGKLQHERPMPYPFVRENSLDDEFW